MLCRRRHDRDPRIVIRLLEELEFGEMLFDDAPWIGRCGYGGDKIFRLLTPYDMFDLLVG